MPAAPIAKGVIFTVTILIAAGVAAYELPEVRRWVENSRRKIAMTLHSLGDEISPKAKENKRHDPSMDEEKSGEAEERRRQARAEIMERGRILEEKRKKKRDSMKMSQRDSGVGSFDSLVDEHGNLREEPEKQDSAVKTTAIEPESSTTTGLTKRNIERHETETLRQPIPISQSLGTSPPPSYEQELRQNWNLPLPPVTTAASQTSHASESILDLTPTSEFPDREISIPSLADVPQASQHSQYFSISHPADAASRTISPQPSQTAASESSYYYAHPTSPDVAIPYPNPPSAPQLQSQPQQRTTATITSTLPHAPSSAASTADTSDLEHIRGSDLGSESGHRVLSEEDDDDEEDADGVKTPEGSLWTDVESEVSGDQ